MVMNAYRQDILDWLGGDDWQGWYAVTLTLHSSLPDASGNPVRITEQSASRSFRHFLNVTNKRHFGNAARRYNKRCEVIPTFEYGNKGGNLHYHAFIKKPNHVPDWLFQCRLRGDWFATEWGWLSVDIQKNTDSGWLDYITKDTRGNTGNPDWDFENVDYQNIWFAG